MNTVKSSEIRCFLVLWAVSPGRQKVCGCARCRLPKRIQISHQTFQTIKVHLYGFNCMGSLVWVHLCGFTCLGSLVWVHLCGFTCMGFPTLIRYSLMPVSGFSLIRHQRVPYPYQVPSLDKQDTGIKEYLTFT